MHCHTHHGVLVQQSRFCYHPDHKGTCSAGHHLPLVVHWKDPNTECCFSDLSNLCMNLGVDKSSAVYAGEMGAV